MFLVNELKIWFYGTNVQVEAVIFGRSLLLILRLKYRIIEHRLVRI